MIAAPREPPANNGENGMKKKNPDRPLPSLTGRVFTPKTYLMRDNLRDPEFRAEPDETICVRENEVVVVRRYSRAVDSLIRRNLKKLQEHNVPEAENDELALALGRMLLGESPAEPDGRSLLGHGEPT
jgi:hypothetical protein